MKLEKINGKTRIEDSVRITPLGSQQKVTSSKLMSITMVELGHGSVRTSES